MSDDLVQFSLSARDVVVSGSVPKTFFESDVQPVMSLLLKELSERVESDAALPEDGASPKGDRLDLSVKTICERIGAKTGSDLMKAGATSLALVQRQSQFTRKEILAEAQKAGGYWKASYSNDAGRYVTTLQSQKFLIEGASGQLSLSAKAEADMLDLLSNES